MIEDNTPTVNARKKKPTRHQRLRLETVKRLRALGATRKRKAGKEDKVTVLDPNVQIDAAKADPHGTENATKVSTRAPKVKKATLAQPPVPKAKFRKRQKHKSWLPTHIFHAKRAHMTPPSAPMWRFALPLGPTQKSYRPIHRASSERGAVCWDTSYVATIGLDGDTRSVVGMLRALAVDEECLTGPKGRKWRAGTRALETMVYEREKPHHLIAPVTIIWCAADIDDNDAMDEDKKQKRKLFLRAHPSAFFELWEEVVRLAKVAKPAVQVEDLRFELGSIELKGPGSTEALLGALWPSLVTGEKTERPAGSVEKTWTGLAGLTNAGMLPSGTILAMSVQDPKLHFPPRTVRLPSTQEEQATLLETLADWPVDFSLSSPAIFDRKLRTLGSKLASQKAVNRRKSLAAPGEFPQPLPNDPQIPVLLYTSTPPYSTPRQHQSTSWHLIAPWKAIQPMWYSLIYYPLSTGQQPRFGGLNEHRQLAFEAGVPWFPGDFPGTKAGWEWEIKERCRRWEDWKKRPKGKRVSWENVRAGGDRKGEVGVGWACDWEMLLGPGAASAVQDTDGSSREAEQSKKSSAKEYQLPSEPAKKPDTLTHLPPDQAVTWLSDPTKAPPDTDNKLLTVRLTLLTRGVSQTCARIYRLPSITNNHSLRKAWLALKPSNQPKKNKSRSLPRSSKDTPPHILQQRLAASLLEPPKAGGEDYPSCPGKEDLIGFVTSGNFNLAEGQGTGVGALAFGKVVEEVRMATAAGDDSGAKEEGRLCIVRNAGESVGRLARWDVA